VCYAEGVIGLSIYLHSINHLGYDASLRCNRRTIFPHAEKTGDLAVKHDDARAVDWTHSHEISPQNAG